MENGEVQALPLGGGVRAFVSRAHRFGADAVLLAAFAAPLPGARCADLLSGCGIVSLLWCRDDARREADAFELQHEAAVLARRAAAENGFTGMRVFEQDVRALPPAFFGQYDLVACNPPYRAQGAGRTSPLPARETARAEGSCTLEDTVRAAARLLRGGGRFCLCLRPERLAEAFALLAPHGLAPKRLRLVQQRVDTPPFLALVEAKQGARPGLACEPVLLCEEEGAPTPAWRALFAPLGADAARGDEGRMSEGE